MMRRYGLIVLLAAVSVFCAPAGAATPADESATHALLAADYRLEATLAANGGQMLAAERTRAAAVGRECAGVLRGSPAGAAEYEEDLPPANRGEPSAREQGERDRAEQQWQELNLELSLTFEDSAYAAVKGSLAAYATTLERLAWSDQTLTARVRFDAASTREVLDDHGLAVCADLRNWANSAFRRLPAASKAFEAARGTRYEHAPTSSLASLIAPSESSRDRRLVRRTDALRRRVRRTLAGGRRAYVHLRVALGLRETPSTEQELEPVIAHGNTGDGSTYEIQKLAGEGAHRGGCRHAVYVSVEERGSGSSGDLCLGARSGPSASCAGNGVTIQLGVASDVRSVSIGLSNGRTQTVRPILISARDGGPGGVIIAGFRAGHPRPVSLHELASDGRVLHNFDVHRFRCERSSSGPRNLHGEPGPSIVALANAPTPSGQLAYFSATVFTIEGQTVFNLGPGPGRRDSSAGESVEHRTARGFAWSLSTECAPDAYAAIYGVLKPPGVTVLARTPAGLAPLAKAEIDPKLGAGGPLFYGVFAAVPSEIVVQQADGSVLYTESLAAKAAEEADYCEGYAEPSS